VEYWSPPYRCCGGEETRRWTRRYVYSALPNGLPRVLSGINDADFTIVLANPGALL
jgi:hypothetical protein